MSPPLDPVRTTLDLMAIESTSGNEHDVVVFADELLSGRGWKTTRIPVEARRDCLYAEGSATPTVVLSTHLDTVPPFIAPRLDGDTIHGRGACDAKGIAASMIVAAERLRDEGVAVGMLFVVGEETTHDGAHAANAWAAKHLAQGKRILVNGEPTDNTLALGTKGALRVIVRTRGRAAHSAYPELGQSALLDIVRLLGELEEMEWPRDELLGLTTVNIGSISGGVADNVIAPAAEAEWGVMVPPIRRATVNGFATSVAAYATDIPALGNWGTPYLYGPGSIHVAHTPNECVSVASLRQAADDYVKIARTATH
jgi:acetylornithine deacetylase